MPSFRGAPLRREPGIQRGSPVSGFRVRAKSAPRNDALSPETPFMTRIAVGGFLHETNTFAPTKAVYAGFVHGGGWPAMALGAQVLDTMRNINVGLAGFIEAAEANGWELAPTIFCAASP